MISWEFYSLSLLTGIAYVTGAPDISPVSITANQHCDDATQIKQLIVVELS
jgi:hypothetical protein